MKITKNVSTIKAPPIYKIIISQFFAVSVITAIGYSILGWISAYSLLLGGLICAVPNGYFAIKAFQYRGARAAFKIVRAFYVGEAIKISLMCAGFALAFIYVKPLSFWALFAGFIIVHIVGLWALIAIQPQKQKF
jgi:ATP synthase protein I